MLLDIENSFYHITPTRNLELIRKNGLQTQTGENCKMDNDNTTRVYFAEGIQGLYKVISRFMKAFEYNQKQTNLEKTEFAEQETERNKLAQNKEMFSEKVLEFSQDGNFFDKFAENLKSYTYLQLDLQEDIDFVRTDDERMTKSNMYTEKSVEVDKINQVILDNERSTTAYDFVKYIYANYQDVLWNEKENPTNGDAKYYLQLLDAFMDREVQKEKAKECVDFSKIDLGKNKELLKSTIDRTKQEITSSDIENIVSAVQRNDELKKQTNTLTL